MNLLFFIETHSGTGQYKKHNIFECSLCDGDQIDFMICIPINSPLNFHLLHIRYGHQQAHRGWVGLVASLGHLLHVVPKKSLNSWIKSVNFRRKFEFEDSLFIQNFFCAHTTNDLTRLR